MLRLLFLSLLYGASAFEFWASPKRAHVQVGGTITVSCVSNVPLTDCRFYMNAFGYLSPIPTRVTNYKGTSIEYFSNATACSVQLRNVDMAFYDLVACRGRNQEGEYKSSELSLAVSNFEPYDLQIDVKGRQGVALPEEEFSFICRSSSPLTYCTVWLPNGHILNLSNGSSTVPENTYGFQYTYHGAGLEKGECGIKYSNVNEELNGIHWCSTKASPETLQYDYTWVIVAMAPTVQHLDVSTANLQVGDVLVANCSAEDSRPISTMSWFLGDRPITNGITNVTVESPHWPDPHFKMTLSQTLTKVLEPEDNGKDLRCVVGNIALPGGSSETVQTIKLQWLQVGTEPYWPIFTTKESSLGTTKNRTTIEETESEVKLNELRTKFLEQAYKYRLKHYELSVKQKQAELQLVLLNLEYKRAKLETLRKKSLCKCEIVDDTLVKLPNEPINNNF